MHVRDRLHVLTWPFHNGLRDVSMGSGPIDQMQFENAITALHSRVSRVYLHVDLDSLDISEARANKYAAPGGPSLARLLECIRLVTERQTWPARRSPRTTRTSTPTTAPEPRPERSHTRSPAASAPSPLPPPAKLAA
jgi:hypothetical protein